MEAQGGIVDFLLAALYRLDIFSPVKSMLCCMSPLGTSSDVISPYDVALECLSAPPIN